MNVINTKDLPHEEWLRIRKSSIGGSDAAAILGKNKYRNALDVYLDKLGQTPPVEDNKFMRYGRKLEPVIADTFEEDSGCTVQQCHRMIIDSDQEYLHSNPDRQILAKDPESTTGILECKTVGSHLENDWIYDVDPYWYIQLQHYLMIFGYKYGYIAWLVDREFKFKRFHADKDLQEYMRKEFDKFWNGHVKKKIPPEGDNEQINEYLSPIEGKTIDVDDDIYDIYTELMDVKSKKKEYEDKEKNLKNAFKLIASDNEKVLYGEQILATQSEQTRYYPKKIKELKEKYPEVFEEFITESTFSRINYRKTKS